MGTEKSGIIQIVQQGGLVDLVTLYNYVTCDMLTCIKGTERIDAIFGTSNILPYIRQCKYLQFN